MTAMGGMSEDVAVDNLAWKLITTLNRYLFVYGTLDPVHAPAEIAAQFAA